VGLVAEAEFGGVGFAVDEDVGGTVGFDVALVVEVVDVAVLLIVLVFGRVPEVVVAVAVGAGEVPIVIVAIFDVASVTSLLADFVLELGNGVLGPDLGVSDGLGDVGFPYFSSNIFTLPPPG